MYNWPEILKNKSRKELYDIYLGKSLLNSEAEKYAEIELRNIGFKFDNLELEKEKMELESLIEEKTSSNSLFFKWDSKTYLFQLLLT